MLKPSIYNYTTEVQIVGAEMLHGILYAHFMLKELYDDGSGDTKEIYRTPATFLHCDAGFEEILHQCHNFMKQNRKENYMSDTMKKNLESSSLKELADIYNRLVPKSAAVKRFSDRATAIERIGKLFEVVPMRESKSVTEQQKKEFLARLKKEQDKKEKKAEDEIKQEKKNIKLNLKVKSTTGIAVNTKTDISHKEATKSKASKEIKQGKRVKFDGLHIKILTEGKKNPRQEGSLGHKNFALYYDGMPYEELKSNGGANKHFIHDIKKNFISLV